MGKIVFILLPLAIASYIFAFNQSSVPNSQVSSLTQKVIDRSNYTSDELNTIEVFDRTVDSVVNIAIVSHQTQKTEGAGSGFVWDKEGHIVTNYHVVASGADFLIAFHHDKKLYEAVVVGISIERDIAVLKLKKQPQKFEPLKKGKSSSLLIGQKTLAIGNPFGLGHSMSTGVVSSVGRTIKAITGVDIVDVIQTDAAINPGNSGGPLIDSRGQVIGMNTAIFSQSGNSAGIGFAVPIDTINRIVPQLIKYGKEIRPVMGVVLLSEQVTRGSLGFTKGVMIKEVIDNTPAARARLRGFQRTRQRIFLGDLIVGINDDEIANYNDFFSRLSKYEIGDEITVKFIRDNKFQETKLTLTSNNK